MAIEEVEIGLPLGKDDVSHAGFAPAADGFGGRERDIEKPVGLRAP
jgi:hypothetical protein